MLEARHAPQIRQLHGHGQTPRHQQHRNVNGKVILDVHQPRNNHVQLTVLTQLALLSTVVSTEPLNASKVSNGSKSAIYTQMPLHGFQGLITWQAPLRLEFKERTMKSGR
jgi:hypothetical protein